jgi:lipoprotein-anchoring transpeptidase ErfK/SrfK
MRQRYPHHISYTAATVKERIRRTPRWVLVFQGLLCIFVLIMSALSLNSGDPLVTHAAPGTITLISTIGPDETAMPVAQSPTVTYIPTKTPEISPPDGIPQVAGQLIYVSETQQWMWVFRDNSLVFTSPVTTGRPELKTPPGRYHVQGKLSNVMFYSPWPQSSPFYYTPEHVFYALYFREGGYYIHDASWREKFGPGSDVPHYDSDGTLETGSHGCVNVPPDFAAQLYKWTEVGATVIIAP